MEESSQHSRNTGYKVTNGLNSLFLKKYSREEVDHFFDTKDRDFDGRLSFAEIMGEETPIEKLFKMMDKNGDGFVSKKVSLISFFIDLHFSVPS